MGDGRLGVPQVMFELGDGRGAGRMGPKGRLPQGMGQLGDGGFNGIDLTCGEGHFL